MPSFAYIGLPALIARGQNALEKGVAMAAEDLQGKAQAVTPVDTGTLKASIHVEGPFASATSVEARVSTGGEASEYAIFVHEGTSRMAAHKYIERPLLAQAPVYREMIQRAAQDAY